MHKRYIHFEAKAFQGLNTIAEPGIGGEKRNPEVDLRVRLIELAYDIPAIRGKFGRLRTDDGIITLAEGYGTSSSGEKLCISFLLGVWSGGFPWVENEDDELGIWTREYGIRRFDLIDAAMSLSPENLRPILVWAAKPFWP